MDEFGASKPLAFPLCTSSVYTLADLEALDQVSDGMAQGYIYARDSHPNAVRLSHLLSKAEGAASGIVCSSGMAGISALVLSLASQGDRILASSLLYGRTIQLFGQELTRLGIETTFVDPCSLQEVEEQLRQKRSRLLFVETLSNPLLRVVDIAALAEMAHQHDCYLVVDNTFATPALCRPLEMGADFVVESLTKMISGHSDVTLGWLGISPRLADAEQWHAQIAQTSSIWGFSGSPFDSWQAERGLGTLSLRMEKACDNALSLAQWLTQQSQVRQVVYPGLESHSDYGKAEEVLGGRFGNLISFEIEGGRKGVSELMRSVPEIPFSPSLGNFTTTWSHPATTSHRYVSPAQRKKQGITDGLIRLSVGIEPVETLQSRLAPYTNSGMSYTN